MTQKTNLDGGSGDMDLKTENRLGRVSQSKRSERRGEERRRKGSGGEGRRRARKHSCEIHIKCLIFEPKFFFYAMWIVVIASHGCTWG